MTSTTGGRPLRPGGLAQTATLSWLLVLAVEWPTNILACCLPVALRSLSYPMVSAMRQHPWPLLGLCNNAQGLCRLTVLPACHGITGCGQDGV